jgi:hypothetical protein
MLRSSEHGAVRHTDRTRHAMLACSPTWVTHLHNPHTSASKLGCDHASIVLPCHQGQDDLVQARSLSSSARSVELTLSPP